MRECSVSSMIEMTKTTGSMLPPGWIYARLGDISEDVANIDPSRSPNRIFDYLDIQSIDNRAMRISHPKRILGAKAPTRARQLVRSGDILFSTVRTYLRNIAFVDDIYDGQVASTGFCVVRIHHELDSRYFFYYMQTSSFLSLLGSMQRGVMYPAVRARDVLSSIVPVPPIAEQHRIIEKTERLLKETRDISQIMESTLSRVKTYRQAVIDSAYEGRLVPNDPNARPFLHSASRKGDSSDERSEIETTAASRIGVESESSLPKNWRWETLGNVIESMKNGIYRTKECYGSGVPCLRMYNINDGRIVWKDIKHMRLSAREIEEFELRSGDILLNRVNSRELLGKAAVVPTGLGKVVFESKNIRIRVRDGIEPAYLSRYLQTRRAKSQILLGAKQTVGMATVSQADISGWIIPLAPSSEQSRIVAEIESRLLASYEVEDASRSTLYGLDRLKYSILNRAVKGDLVPQNPNDAPASILLEKIRAERNVAS